MGVNEIRRVAATLTAAASLLWLVGVQGQPVTPKSCSELGEGWQTMEVSGQTSALYTAQPPCGVACPDPEEGNIFVCFNPQQNCYLAMAGLPFPTSVPFNARRASMGLAIESASQCGEFKATREDRSFDVMLISTNPGDGCLNKLELPGDEDGFFEGGELLEDPASGKPAVLVKGSGAVVLFDVEDDALRIPGSHCADRDPTDGHCLAQFGLQINVPLLEGGGVGVKNKDTGEVIAGGSVNNTCGARLTTPPVTPIPTLPQYGMLLLTLGLILAAVGITRRRMGA